MLYGISALSNRELIALLLRHGSEGVSALDMAELILTKAGGIANLASLSLDDLVQIKGIQRVKGLMILAPIEIARRMALEKCVKKDVLKNPEAIVEWLKFEIGMKDQETFLVIYLNVRNEIIDYEILFVGTLDCSNVYPREIFKKALLCNASSIIAVHNHPSGNPSPSDEDIFVTDALQEVGKLLHIELLDHLIVSRSEYFSFKEAGMI